MARRSFNFKPPPGTPVNQSLSLSQGLVGAWEFNEGGGVLVRDSAGLVNLGTLTNGPTWGVGAAGSEVRFTAASSHHVLIANKPGALNGAGGSILGLTAMIRFRMNSLRNYNALFTHQSGNSTSPIDCYVDAGGNLNVFMMANQPSVSGTLAANTWYTVAYSYMAQDPTNSSRATFRVYVDGVQKGVLNLGTAGTGADTTDAYRIGSRGDGATLMDGSIAWARLWNRALTPSEVSEQYVDPHALYRGPRVFRGFSPGGVEAGGAANLVEAADTVSSAGVAISGASATVTEAADTLSSAGTSSITASGSPTEAADSSTSAGSVLVVGAASVTESGDTLLAGSAGYVSAEVDMTEDADVLSAAGVAPWYKIQNPTDIWTKV